MKKSELRQLIKEEIEKLNESSEWSGGSECRGGCYIGLKGLKAIKDLSKKNKNKIYFMTDDNYSNLGNWYVKNGKIVKATTANPEWDLDNSPKLTKIKNSVILKFKELKGK